jgi:hypothetical protein
MGGRVAKPGWRWQAQRQRFLRFSWRQGPRKVESDRRRRAGCGGERAHGELNRSSRREQKGEVPFVSFAALVFMNGNPNHGVRDSLGPAASAS